ncbi:MAG: serine/threonine protein kinase [Deltaproteobacteria bacterium]|nr:serine/threonine protein kinase [Deltaproteobacteria bacterium]
MSAPDPYLGREIVGGQFRIVKKIGTGGMGSVYKAEQPEMNRHVAVKILHASLKDRKDLVSRFRREARAMSHLSHPNTVKVMMYGELDEGALYIVMEYLEGRNLNQTVRRDGPLPLPRAIPVLLQVCGALQEAHSLGMVHRDLKPENIFLTDTGGIKDFAKVLDFGLAKVTERELRPGSIMLTQEGMVFGTPEFMSPEQAQGKVLDARSDIYSLAVILYEALTGKLPFRARTPMEYIQLHVMRPPIPLDERVPGLTFPPGLGAVIAKALEKNPDHRYQSAADFAEALRPFGQPQPNVFLDGPSAFDGTGPRGAPIWDTGLPPSAGALAAGGRPAAAAPATGPGPYAATPAGAQIAPPPRSQQFQLDLESLIAPPPKQKISPVLVVVALLALVAGVVLTIIALQLGD